MGTYNLSADELEEPLEEWLKEQEGQVCACHLAEAWNRIAKRYGWLDGLKDIQITKNNRHKRGSKHET